MHEETPPPPGIPEGAIVVDLDFGLPREFLDLGPLGHTEPDNRVAALRLDADSICVHELQNVNYQTHPREVERSRRERDDNNDPPY